MGRALSTVYILVVLKFDVLGIGVLVGGRLGRTAGEAGIFVTVGTEKYRKDGGGEFNQFKITNKLLPAFSPS